MRRSLSFAVSFVVVMLATSAPAAACSVGPEFDAVKETQVFVIGRIADVRVQRGTGAKPAEIPVAYVTLDVTAVLKGRADARITVRDPGAGDGCSALEGDPTSYTGRYAALALTRTTAEGGTSELVSSRLLGAAFGTNPRDDAIVALVARHRLQLPATAADPASPYLAALPLVGLAALVVLAALKGRLSRRR